MSYFYAITSYIALNAGMQARATVLFKKGLTYRLNAHEPVLSVYLRQSQHAYLHSQLDNLSLDETYRAYLKSIVLKHEKKYKAAWKMIRNISDESLLPFKVRILYDMKNLDVLIELSNNGTDVLEHLQINQKEILVEYLIRSYHFNEAERMIAQTIRNREHLQSLFETKSSHVIAKYKWRPFRDTYLNMVRDPEPADFPALLSTIETLEAPQQDAAHLLLVNRFFNRPAYRSALNDTSVNHLNDKPDLLRYVELEALHTLDFNTPHMDSNSLQLEELFEHYHGGQDSREVIQAIHELIPKVKLDHNHIRSLRKMMLDDNLNLEHDELIRMFKKNKRAYKVFQYPELFLNTAINRRVDNFIYSNFTSRTREKIYQPLVNELVHSKEQIRLPEYFVRYLKRNRHHKLFNMYILVRHTYQKDDTAQVEKYINELTSDDQFKMRLYLAKFLFIFDATEDALFEVKAAEKIKNSDPDLFRHFIRIHHYTGDITNRFKYLKKMRSEYPDRLMEHEYEMAEDEHALLHHDWDLEIDSSPSPLPAQDPSKILFVLNKAYPVINGYTVRSDEMIQRAKEYGYRPVIATRLGWSPEHEGYETPSRYDEGIDSYYIDRSDEYLTYRTPLKSYFSQYAREIMDIAEKEQPGTIYAASNFQNAYSALTVGKYMNIPTVYEVRGLWHYTQSTKKPIFYQSERFYLHEKYELKCCELADQITCISESLKDYLIGKGIDASKITVLPNGVNSNTLTPIRRDETLIQKYGLKDKVVVGFIGSITDYEGLDLVLEAVHAINEKRLHPKSFVCMIVGQGPAKEGLMKKAESLDMMEQVIFPGKIPREEVQNYYSVIDVAPFPRTNEPLCQLVTPLKPYEAMAMEKKVIVSDVAALQEMVVEDGNGKIFKAEDVESLITVMLETIGNEQLGTQARKWVVIHRDWNVVIQNLYRLLPPLPDRGV